MEVIKPYPKPLKKASKTKQKNDDDPADEVLHTRNGDAVSQCAISGGVRRAGDICPSVRESLEPLTFQRCQTAYQCPNSCRKRILQRVPALCCVIVLIKSLCHIDQSVNCRKVYFLSRLCCFKTCDCINKGCRQLIDLLLSYVRITYCQSGIYKCILQRVPALRRITVILNLQRFINQSSNLLKIYICVNFFPMQVPS